MAEKSDRVIRIGGDGGEGVISCGELLAQACARSGYEIFTLLVIPAEIKGGHANFLVRVDTSPVLSQGEALDALVCFNEEAFTLLKGQLKPGGLLIFDPAKFMPQGTGFVPYGVPLDHLAIHEVKSALSKNVVAMGMLAAMLGIPFEVCERMIRTHKKWLKKEGVIERNVLALRLGFDYVKDHPSPVDLTLPPVDAARGERMVAPGNDMLSLGALVAGLKFYAGYPITPASTILEFMERELPRFGGYAIQTEDEIAAISAAIGASFAGAKAMTATSGPGLSLMVESLGLAAMTETPLVVVDVQRGGPSTGLPTKVEQSDLNLAVYGGHGDAPRIVLAPADVEDCFYTMVDALNLAETYQMPVLLLSDYSLATRTQTIAKPDFAAVRVKERLKPSANDLEDYRRYRLTENGVSPMAIPGMPGRQFTATGLEHNEYGAPHMTPATHKAMTEKRYRKVLEASREPGYVRRFGLPQAKVGIVCWGSTTGAAREAIGRAVAKGYPVAALQCRMVYPIPQEVRSFLDEMDAVLVPELNFTGQFAQMLRARFLKPVEQLNKVEGLPFTAAEIYERLVALCESPLGARTGARIQEAP
jgi:2-oxoglutarate ferredoxin oxidoreductase subunit alpha